MTVRHIIWAALLSTITAPVFARDVSAPAVEGVGQVAPTIDSLFQAFQVDAHVPGMVYGVVKDGQLAHVQATGVQDLTDRREVTPNSLFRVASMTKAFTALSILSLRDKRKLRLDDFAEQYVPEMKAWKYPTADSPKIRVRDLLNHVGGLVTDDPWGDRQQALPDSKFTELIKGGVPFSRPPQMQHEYSNFGYALLGRIVSKASGMPYRRYVEKTFLGPLGMESSGFDFADTPKERRAVGYRWENGSWVEEPTMKDGAFNSMGGLHVSANDYAKWVKFLLNAWPPRDEADDGPVKRATVREMAQGLNFVAVATRSGASGATACKQAAAYAMGWRVAQDCDLGLTLAHGGGYPGYGSHVMLMPEFGVGIFALSNRTYAGPSAPAWDSAVAMYKAGLLGRRQAIVSPVLSEMEAIARTAYNAGNLEPFAGRLAMNFLLDRSSQNWGLMFAELKAQVGMCTNAGDLVPSGALSATFSWKCDRGTMSGQILMAPTNPATIQALRFRPVVPAGS
ncbi:MAG: serine hydrolase domain-containing protein [Sphingorhabdus sp.]